MHLISVYVKAVLSVMIQALKMNTKYESFMTKMRSLRLMNDIERLNLPWWPLLLMRGDKFAGYGSENYIAFGRFFKVLAHVINNIEKKEPVLIPMDQP